MSSPASCPPAPPLTNSKSLIGRLACLPYKDSGKKDEVLDALAKQPGPSQAKEQQPTGPFASSLDSQAPSASSALNL
ncbi:hypothetical protein PtA15_7A231 [Puccinia triticina]|uniref:Uncharacterized protein n=1 Tax=Puccinia triticina TaxID=208348 RepID=A0ABY7CP92_9BASI|nr:uncharacterized protein PtA15_7A231 [Puccinia triticina]WAQ86505.1 hypothetical protein PtA15_7A231 [Puccinia triticina]